MPLSFCLRLLPVSSFVVLCLSACSLEPMSFWTDTTKEETDLTQVPPAPVPKRPGHAVGLNVINLPGYVRTPFTHPPRLVDVRGLQPGTLVVCPFTQKLFYLPENFVDARPRSLPQGPPVYRMKREPAHQQSIPPLAPTAAPAARDRELPEGIVVSGRPGFVYSPYADKSHMVDVSGLSAGMEVRCPYTGKVFRVPAAKR